MKLEHIRKKPCFIYVDETDLLLCYESQKGYLWLRY